MSQHFSRQSFLGADSGAFFARAKVGLIGLSGGGSHLVQQLGHVGFRRFVLYDPQSVDTTNHNRLVGGTLADGPAETLKTEVARRMLDGIVGKALVLEPYPCRWQDNPEPIRECDMIFGSVDTFAQRSELEVCARRYLIPYIDIGLDVNIVEPEPPRMGGQVILSMPGGPCMRCLGFLTEDRLSREAARYGDVGPRAQVVWANGVLASTAVGVAVDLLTDWTQALRQPVYLSYDGNRGTVTPHVRLEHLPPGPCSHFPLDAVGEPRFTPL
jgi:hypothetical protein